MRMFSIVVLVGLCCWCGSLPAAGSTPFSLGSQGGILVAVVLNGAGPFSMLLDTGASHSSSGALRLLTRERGQTWVRSWSPDGRRLAVAAMRDGLWSLRAIEVATGRQETIHESGSPRVFVRYPEWSARGDAIVFERGEMRANVWTLELAGGH